jgi:TPR repeat protein
MDEAILTAVSDGDGIPKDEVEAYKWFLLARAQGSEEAKKFAVIAESRLTQEQITEGQRRSAEFVPKKEKPNPSFGN